ncbi:unnamed protein product [Prorocentrum cordatum]|uniref:RanBP2-type domain-containing protein n=1 Tax=Prorocentrum cordatum TaxID=2364126 RepID=A0ABN9XNV5_9DINO|nr:unnamed protein product [Polarella glacialis]
MAKAASRNPVAMDEFPRWPPSGPISAGTADGRKRELVCAPGLGEAPKQQPTAREPRWGPQWMQDYSDEAEEARKAAEAEKAEEARKAEETGQWQRRAGSSCEKNGQEAKLEPNYSSHITGNCECENWDHGATVSIECPGRSYLWELESYEDCACAAGLRNAAAAAQAAPRIREVMMRVREAVIAVRSSEPSLQVLRNCCGSSPSRPPPGKDVLVRLRAAVGRALGLAAHEVQAARSASPICFRLVQAVLQAAGDSDQELGHWLEFGAPMGITRPTRPGGHFPLAESPNVLSPADLAAGAFTFTSNHPSFDDSYGEPEPPTLDLIREHLGKGFGEVFDDEAAAAERFGQIPPAPLGNVRKARPDGTFKNRIIQDLLINCVNLAASTHERVVLPRGVDHGADLAALARRAGQISGGQVQVLILDFQDAFMMVPMHESERRFNVAVLRDPPLEGRGRVIARRALGCGGKSNPLVYSRLGSFIARSTQAMLCSDECRLQLYVDDPALTLAGTEAMNQLNADVALRWWLALGLGLAWKKGVFAVGGHQWIGIRFDIVGRVAVRRFSAAAAWLLALICGAVLPLRRVVHEFPDEYRLPLAPDHIEFDASPWGGSGVLVRDGTPIQYWHCTWPDSLCRRFGAAVGLPQWQTLWEYIAALVCLLVWADDFAVGQCLTLMGDNIGALTGAAHFRGRRELNAVTREISWRKAAFQWSYVVAHLPSEANDWADSLSRLAAVSPKPLPQALRAAQAAPPPALDVIWRTWVADCPPPAPTLTQLPAGEGMGLGLAQGRNSPGVRFLAQYLAARLSLRCGLARLAGRLKTCANMLSMWGMDMVPLTVEKIMALGASLKAGRYRSARLYLSAARVEAERGGHALGVCASRALTDATRARERGLGPSSQASPLPMEDLYLLPDGEQPWVPGGPANLKWMIIAGAWWMLREIEISCTRAGFVTGAGSGPALEAPLEVSAGWALQASSGKRLEPWGAPEGPQTRGKGSKRRRVSGEAAPARDIAKKGPEAEERTILAERVNDLEVTVASLRQRPELETASVRRVCTDGPEFVENVRSLVVHRAQFGAYQECGRWISQAMWTARRVIAGKWLSYQSRPTREAEAEQQQRALHRSRLKDFPGPLPAWIAGFRYYRKVCRFMASSLYVGCPRWLRRATLPRAALAPGSFQASPGEWLQSGPLLHSGAPAAGVSAFALAPGSRESGQPGCPLVREEQAAAARQQQQAAQASGPARQEAPQGQGGRPLPRDQHEDGLARAEEGLAGGEDVDDDLRRAMELSVAQMGGGEEQHLAGTWSCPGCTFENQGSDPRCAVCEGPRPAREPAGGGAGAPESAAEVVSRPPGPPDADSDSEAEGAAASRAAQGPPAAEGSSDSEAEEAAASGAAASQGPRATDDTDSDDGEAAVARSPKGPPAVEGSDSEAEGAAAGGATASRGPRATADSDSDDGEAAVASSPPPAVEGSDSEAEEAAAGGATASQGPRAMADSDSDDGEAAVASSPPPAVEGSDSEAEEAAAGGATASRGPRAMADSDSEAGSAPRAAVFTFGDADSEGEEAAAATASRGPRAIADSDSEAASPPRGSGFTFGGAGSEAEEAAAATASRGPRAADDAHSDEEEAAVAHGASPPAVEGSEPEAAAADGAGPPAAAAVSWGPRATDDAGSDDGEVAVARSPLGPPAAECSDSEAEEAAAASRGPRATAGADSAASTPRGAVAAGGAALLLGPPPAAEDSLSEVGLEDAGASAPRGPRALEECAGGAGGEAGGPSAAAAGSEAASRAEDRWPLVLVTRRPCGVPMPLPTPTPTTPRQTNGPRVLSAGLGLLALARVTTSSLRCQWTRTHRSTCEGPCGGRCTRRCHLLRLGPAAQESVTTSSLRCQWTRTHRSICEGPCGGRCTRHCHLLRLGPPAQESALAQRRRWPPRAAPAAARSGRQAAAARSRRQAAHSPWPARCH